MTKASLKLNWKKPLSDGGVDVTEFLIDMKKSGDADWKQIAIVKSNVFSYVAQGLSRQTEYSFRVMAKNMVGQSEPLETAEAIEILPGPPSAPDGPLEIISKTNTSVTIQWNPPKDDGGSDIFCYVLACKESRKKMWLEAATVEAYKTKAVIEDLLQGQDYEIRVFAKNEFGISEALQTSEPVKVERPPALVAPPSPPQSFKVAQTVMDSVTMTWRPPEDDGGSPITGYIISKKDMQSKQWEDLERIPEFVNEYTVAHLRENTRYSFKLSAVNEIGISETVQIKEPVLIKRFHDKPGEPGKPDILEITDESVIVQWQLPDSDGGSAITNYVVEKLEVGSKKGWLQGSKGIVKQTHYELKGLKKGASYQFRVSAENDVGIGNPGEISEVVKCEKVDGKIKKIN